MNVRFAAPLLITLCALCAALPAWAASPSGVALLPSVGPASEDDRRAVDKALRGALAGVDDIDLLSPVATRDNLMSLAEMGLVCLPEDVPCLVKLGIVADVAWVLVPEVEKAQGAGASKTIAITIGAIDVAAASRARTVDDQVAIADGEAVGALALRALGRSTSSSNPPDKDPPDKDPPNKEPPDKDPPDKDPPHVDPNDPNAPPSTGLLLAGIGGVVAGVSLVGALVADLVFLDVIEANKETRQNMVPVGAVLWGTTAIGAITAGVGAYMLSEETAE